MIIIFKLVKLIPEKIVLMLLSYLLRTITYLNISNSDIILKAAEDIFIHLIPCMY